MSCCTSAPDSTSSSNHFRPSHGGRRMQRAQPALIGSVNLSALREQQRNCFRMAVHRRHQRRDALDGARIYVGARPNQQIRDGGLPADDGCYERRDTGLSRGIWIGSGG